MATGYGSEVLAAVHETALGMAEAGVIHHESGELLSIDEFDRYSALILVLCRRLNSCGTKFAGGDHHT